MKPAIAISDLFVEIEGNAILANISVSLPAGKIIGLLGPSGAGKTTLIRAILGLQKASQGSITLLDLPAGDPAINSQVGYVTQSPSIYLDLTVRENLDYFAALLGAGPAQIREILDEVELAGQEDRLVGTLSGGQKTRVSLAVALLGSPKILLLDEPTVGLDPVLRQKLWLKFKQLSNKGLTILVSSHVMDEAGKCDELLFIREGVLLAAGTPTAIIKRSQAADMDDAFLKLALEVEK